MLLIRSAIDGLLFLFLIIIFLFFIFLLFFSDNFLALYFLLLLRCGSSLLPVTEFLRWQANELYIEVSELVMENIR